MLQGLFAAVGVNPTQAANVAERIIGWRKKADPADRNGEVEAYKQAGLDYPPRQAPFQNVLELLSALPDVTPDRLQKVLAGRLQSLVDGGALLRLLGPARALAKDTPNPAIRVDARIRLDNGRNARAEVVIYVAKTDDEPFRVLSWRDDSDGPI